MSISSINGVNGYTAVKTAETEKASKAADRKAQGRPAEPSGQHEQSGTEAFGQAGREV